MLLIDEGMEEFKLNPKNQRDEDDYTINWSKKIPWAKRLVQDDPVNEALSPLFYEDGFGNLKTNMLRYEYSWINLEEAAKLGNRFDVSRGCYPEGASVRVDSFWVEDEEIRSAALQSAKPSYSALTSS